jgi:hypothetical protein
MLSGIDNDIQHPRLDSIFGKSRSMIDDLTNLNVRSEEQRAELGSRGRLNARHCRDIPDTER